jgi:hypothetical protein
MTSNQKRLLLSILTLLLLTVCLATFWSFLKSYRLRGARQTNPPEKLASIEGWRIHRSNGNITVYEGSIASFSLERAKLGPFAIGPLHVARLQKVVLDFYLEGLLSNAGPERFPSRSTTAPPRKTSSEPSSAGNAKLPSKRSPAPSQTTSSPKTTAASVNQRSKPSDTEPVNRRSPTDAFRIDTLEGPLTDIRNGLLHGRGTTRVIEIQGITLNLWAAGKRVFSISSDHARIDRQTGDLVFTGHASLDAAENGSIITHRITWVRKTSLFRIKDPYVLTQAHQTKEGGELETDYRLTTISYNISG